MGEVADVLILGSFGVLVVLAQYVYALTSWPCPGLIDR